MNNELSIFEELSKERKELQAAGDLPEWFTTLGWQMFKEKYLYQAKTYEDQVDRIIHTLRRHCKTKGEYFSGRWKEMLMEGHAYLATPALANTGTDRGYLVSCSGGYIPNSIYGFYDSLTEAAMLTKKGFGTSGYLGDIVPRGTDLSEGGKASGVLPVLKKFVQMSQDVSQGATRRGAWAGYLPLDHEDFWEVADFVKNNPDTANVGWNVSDELIQKLEEGDDYADSLFMRSLFLKAPTGKGYYFFPDKVNRASPQMYKDLGLSVKASNLCVAPETKVMTRDGYKPIEELQDETVDVWNGEEWSEVTPVKTGEDQKLVKVTTSSGQTLDCTEYHKWYVFNGYGKPCVEKRTHELEEGDKLIKFDLPIIEGDKSLKFAYDNGFYSGDGTCIQGRAHVYLYHEKMALSEHLPSVKNMRLDENNKRMTGRAYGLKEKFFVPDEGYSIKSRLEWLSGFLDADGCVYRNGTNEALTASSVELEFLKEVQMMLQTLGVSCKIHKFSDAGHKLLPANDGSGEKKDYYCKESYRLLISSYVSFKLLSLGLDLKRLKITARRPQRDAKQFNRVVSVVDHGRVDDTYCMTEPKRNMVLFNGILTGNCTEIGLHSDEYHTFTCVISGMIASTYEEWKDTDAVQCMTVMLDCMVSEFLELADGVKGLERAVRGTEKGRPIGVGLSGLHTLFQKKMLPFGSFDAHMLNNQIFKHLHDETLKASQWMAQEWGEPEWCRGYGVRNSHRTALAPNVSSSLIFGSESQGISPWHGNVYNEGSASGGMFRVNPEFIELLKRKGKYTDEVIDHVLDNNGSCQDLEFLTEEEKEVFKTAFEINQEDILRLASTRQQHLCQLQSINTFFDADEDEEYIAKIFKKAFLDENIHSMYYMKSQAGVSASRGVCSACES